MTVSDVAAAFVGLLKAGDHHAAAAKFNAPGIVSIEAMDGPLSRVAGAAAVQAKSDWWFANHEVHSVTTEGPYVNGDAFAVQFAIDVTPKATGQRMQATELALYTVADGKIVEERFFYQR